MSVDGINPKQAFGQAKPPHSTVPLAVLAEVGVGMFEGSRKYGRHNYRVSRILASVYYDATRRHLDSWFEGEDTDPDSGLSHVTKAICSLVVLRDSMINGMLADDRPPRIPAEHREYLQRLTNEIVERHPVAKEPFVQAALRTDGEQCFDLEYDTVCLEPDGELGEGIVVQETLAPHSPLGIRNEHLGDRPGRIVSTHLGDDFGFDGPTHFSGTCHCLAPEGRYDDPRTCCQCGGTIFSVRTFAVAPQHSVEHPLIGDNEEGGHE